MKTLLIATTALVMTAGMAAADVSLKGDARFGLQYNDTNTVNTTTLENRVRVQFNMSGTTDSGLSFGATFRVTGSGDTTASDATSGAKAWISGGFGRLEVGQVDAGSDSVGLGIADVGYTGIGVDNLAEGLYAASAANVNYSNKVGAISFAVSFDVPTMGGVAGSGDWSVGAGYDAGNYSFAVGYDRTAAVKTLSLGAGVKMDAISAHVLYSSPDVGLDAFGVDFGYAVNSATSFTVAYGDNGTTNGYGVGVSYNLGGGAKLLAGIGKVGTATKGEVGLTFSF